MKPCSHLSDILPSQFSKEVSAFLSNDIFVIFDMSLTSGVFPLSFKFAVVKPLLTISNPNSLNNIGRTFSFQGSGKGYEQSLNFEKKKKKKHWNCTFTVDHNILINRLENYAGVSGTALIWVRSNLSDRPHIYWSTRLLFRNYYLWLVSRFCSGSTSLYLHVISVSGHKQLEHHLP